MIYNISEENIGAVIVAFILFVIAYKICTAKSFNDDPTFTEKESRRLNKDKNDNN